MRRWALARAVRCVLGLGLASVLLTACGDAEAPQRSSATPEESARDDAPLAPDFTLVDLEGREVSLRSYRGRTVLIDFWATWCTPCVYQIPVLNEFYNEHHDDGLVVLGISVDAEGRQAVAPFAQAHGILYRVLLGSESVARRFGAPGFPSLVVVDPEGRIASLHVGLIERDGLDELVGPLRRTGRWDAPGDGAGRALADSRF